MKRFIALGLLLSLGACSTTPAVTPNYASIVGVIQSDYPLAKAAAQTWEAQNPTQASAIKTINGAIADADPQIALLSASSSPATLQGVDNDLALLISTPAGQALGTGTKADITGVLAILNTALQLAPSILPLL